MDIFLLLLLMLGLSAFFSGSEIAFVVANRLKIEVRARRGGRVARMVADFVQEPSRFLTTTLVGNNIALIVYSTLISLFLSQPLQSLYVGAFGIQAGSDVFVLVVQTIIAALIVLIFGEILPKSILREVSDHAVYYLAIPLKITYYLLLPLIKVAGWTASFLVRPFDTDAATMSQFLRRDFEVIIRESRESGDLDLDKEETELLSNVFSLGTLLARESMVPRTAIKAVEEDASLDDVRKKFVETGFSKLPVYRDNIDSIVGVVFAYDLFQEPGSLSEIIRPVRFVPETKRSKDLLQEYLASKTSIAIVIDEYGGTAGLVTMEDLLEELIGDIQDEFDIEDAIVRQINERTYVVSGRVDVDDLKERIDIKLEDGDFETVAGYLLEHLGTIPAPNDEFVIDGYRFIILKASANRVDLIKIIKEA